MGLFFNTRIKLNKKIGLNVSRSGLSASYRGRYGSFGTRGYSIRMLPGVSFRKSWGGNSKRSGLEVLIGILIFFLFFYIAYNLLLLLIVIVYNVFLFIGTTIKNLRRIIKVNALERKCEKDFLADGNGLTREFVNLSFGSEKLEGYPLFLNEILMQEGESVADGNMICTLLFMNKSIPIYSNKDGKITWYKLPGQQLFEGDRIASIKKIQ